MIIVINMCIAQTKSEIMTICNCLRSIAIAAHFNFMFAPYAPNAHTTKRHDDYFQQSPRSSTLNNDVCTFGSINHRKDGIKCARPI